MEKSTIYLSELNSSADLCNQHFGIKGEEELKGDFARFQKAINEIDRYKLQLFFSQWDVQDRYHDIFPLLGNIIDGLSELQSHISKPDNRPFLAMLIPSIEDIDDFCTNYIEFFRGEDEILKERKDTAPDNYDRYALGLLSKYSAENWISKFINRDEVPIRQKMRLLRLAIKTNYIDEQYRARLSRELKQIDKAIQRNFAIASLSKLLQDLNIQEKFIKVFVSSIPNMAHTTEIIAFYRNFKLEDKKITFKLFCELCLAIRNEPKKGWNYDAIRKTKYNLEQS